MQSLPEEERDRVMTEEKLGGAKLTAAVANSPHRTRSPSIKVRKQLLHLLFSCIDHHNHKPTSVLFSPGAVSGARAGAVGAASSTKRKTGRKEVCQASRDPKDSRRDVAT